MLKTALANNVCIGANDIAPFRSLGSYRHGTSRFALGAVGFNDATSNNDNCDDRFGQIMMTVLLRIARSKELTNKNINEEATTLYECVRGCAFAKSEDRAMACYRLGRMKLLEERERGELESLWQLGDAEHNDAVNLCADSRSLFNEAAVLCGPGTTKLGE